MRPHLMPMPDQADWAAPCEQFSGPVRTVTGAAQTRNAVRLVRDRPYQAQYRALAELTHDLRTPLSGMIGLIDLLDNRALTEADRERLALIRAANEHMLGLVDGVLDREFRSGTANERFHPSQVLNQCITLAQAGAGDRSVNIVAKYSPDLSLPVTGDSDALRVIVNNFLSNAIKFCTSGPITVTAKLRKGATGHTLIVAVRDTGPGIPRSQWSRIFKHGERLTSGVPGSGLGLALCARQAARARGRLAVRSIPGRGTMFLTALPVSVERGIPWTDSQGVNGAVPALSVVRTILAVIDSRSRHTALQAKLECSGFHLVHAVCPSQALDHICTAFAQGRRFDAVLIDEPSDPALCGPLIEAIAIMSRDGAPIPICALADSGNANLLNTGRSQAFGRRQHPDFRPEILSALIAATQTHWPAQSTDMGHSPA